MNFSSKGLKYFAIVIVLVLLVFGGFAYSRYQQACYSNVIYSTSGYWQENEHTCGSNFALTNEGEDVLVIQAYATNDFEEVKADDTISLKPGESYYLNQDEWNIYEFLLDEEYATTEVSFKII